MVTLLRLAGAPEEADAAPPSEKPPDAVVYVPKQKAGVAELLAVIPPKDNPVELVVVVPPREKPAPVLLPPRENPVEAVVVAAVDVPTNENLVEAAVVASFCSHQPSPSGLPAILL